MKNARMWLALFVLLFAGILVMISFLVRYEERSKNNAFLDKGAYMISLMALYHIRDFEAGRHDLLMRTISENISKDGFLYLFVHDQQGENIFSVAPGYVSSQIPPPGP